MKDFGSHEDRIKNKVQGLRQKLRIELKNKGLIGTFRTDQLKDGTLMVISGVSQLCPINEFLGHKVVLVNSFENRRAENHAPMNDGCEKCGRRYCDCENKY